MPNRALPTSLFCVFILMASGCGGGGSGILNVQSSYSTQSNQASLENVKRTIITASAVKGWKPTLGKNGHILATRRRAGHVAKVDISYTSDSFNIKYLDSDNMGYDGESISSVYSHWVKDLRNEIKRRLSRL